MALRQQFAQIVATAVLIAAFAVPSVAVAHDGHAHHAPAVAKVTAASPDVAPSKNVPVVRDSEEVASVFTGAPPSDAPNALANRGGPCCGGINGMACCCVALAPNPFETPPVLRSVPFLFGHVLPARGLPPEALPKPPKSFA